VGIDYALFIVNRQRRLILDHGLGAGEAAGRAVGTAGSAVFFAGSTVIIALMGLLVVGITLLSTMAIAAAATIAIAVLLALTLLPALLGLVRERICSTRSWHAARQRATTATPTRGTRWGAGLVHRKYLALAGSLLVPLAVALPALDMKMGLPSGDSYNPDTAQRQSYEQVSDAFGAGYNGPLMVVARSSGDDRPLTPTALTAATTELKDTKGAASVSLAGMD
ncbi:MMPL family transporter, partial [Streptomyces sp. 2MCAF27]